MEKIYSMYERVSVLEDRVRELEGKMMNRVQKSLERNIIIELDIVKRLSAQLLEVRNVLHSEDIADLESVRSGLHKILGDAIDQLNEIDTNNKSIEE